jgi:hypothetical protein
MADQLAFYMGPMAPRLVKRIARESKSPQELREKLADTIPRSTEKEAFLALNKED